jgi:hypothetical protein
LPRMLTNRTQVKETLAVSFVFFKRS